MVDYDQYFKQLTGFKPLKFQARFRETEALYRTLEVPTGLGKTQTVMVDWLDRSPTRRLAWVLPGRALASQVAAVARDLCERDGTGVKVLELMGGSEDADLTLKPDEKAILVGTQDLLVSRALNRGYARSPFRWPIDFALLNNDTQWVFDEVQLLGDALPTSTQLAAFRDSMGVFGECPCVWLSATFDPDWLRTVDFHRTDVTSTRLSKEDEEEPIVRQKLNAPKTLAAAPVECRLPSGCAKFVVERHQEGSLTLVIANRVDRAREIFEALPPGTSKVLLHSRFRPSDRELHLRPILSAGWRGIVVSTQVIEAGLDLDADLMVTDIAPWASLVQRFGRVNRNGRRLESKIFWVDRPLTMKRKNWATPEVLKPKEQEEIARPYELAEVEISSKALLRLSHASPQELHQAGVPLTHPAADSIILRRADLMDLFDTTPDLAGNQIDVSRFVRSDRDTNVYFAWREWDSKQKPSMGEPLRDEELCPVDVGSAKEFITKHQGWVWNPAGQGDWEKVNPDSGIFPGIRILVRCSAGGYLPDTGWFPESKLTVTPVSPRTEQEAPPQSDAHDDDTPSEIRPLLLAAHTDHVIERLSLLLNSLEFLGLSAFKPDLLNAGRKHDWGKAHWVFQRTLQQKSITDALLATLPADLSGEERDEREKSVQIGPDFKLDQLLAKQSASQSMDKHCRSYFRHELASALAMRATGSSVLAAYLAAAHHGKVRVNIRSMPGEKATISTDHPGPDLKAELPQPTRIARGIQDNDRLWAADLGGGVSMPEQILSLDISLMGAESWTDGVLTLLSEHGPFKLAYLEMLLRSADEAASAEEAKVKESSCA